MSWEKRVRKVRSVRRKVEFSRFVSGMTPEDWRAVRALPPRKQQQFWLRMEKGFEGDLRYKLPAINGR
jgi:hypothetical protein